jgi:hypothetical protein
MSKYDRYLNIIFIMSWMPEEKERRGATCRISYNTGFYVHYDNVIWAIYS